MTVITFESVREGETTPASLLRELAARSLFPWLAHAVMDWIVIAAALGMIQFWPHVWTVLAGNSVADYVIIVRFSKPSGKREYVPLAVFHAAAVSLLLACGLWVSALGWYAGLVTAFMMFFRLRLWLEHQGTGDTQRLHLTWWQAAILAPHNAWHHWEHH